jgi:hypothetical protein
VLVACALVPECVVEDGLFARVRALAGEVEPSATPLFLPGLELIERQSPRKELAFDDGLQAEQILSPDPTVSPSWAVTRRRRLPLNIVPRMTRTWLGEKRSAVLRVRPRIVAHRVQPIRREHGLDPAGDEFG